MTRKKSIEIIVAILVLLGLILLIVLLLFRRGGGDVVQDPLEELSEEERLRIERVTEVDSRTIASPANVIARTFVERFGSYSSDVNFSNIEDISTLVTPELRGRLASVAAAASFSGAYYGISTRVISFNSLSATAETEVWRVTTQRSESVETPANTTVRYQDIEVTLVKAGDRWLVSDFTWLD